MIREATLEDVPRLLELGVEMHAESTHRTLTLSPPKVVQEFTWTINNGVCFVKEKDGLVVGFMTGYVRAPYFSEELAGYESMFYLLPQHRHGITATRLISRWAEWCISKGAKQLKPATSCGVAGAERLFKALGYTPVGQVFVKDVE